MLVSIGNFQELLEDAGYLKGDFNPGSNDAPTKKAIRDWFNDVNGYRLNSYRNWTKHKHRPCTIFR